MVTDVFSYTAAAILIALIARAIVETAGGIARVVGGIIALTASRILTIAAYVGRANRNRTNVRRLLPADYVSTSRVKSRIKMKTSISDRLATAAANARKLGQGAFKNPVSSILSLCVLMAVTATIITYSQETAPAEKPAVAMTYPAENVELVDVDGRAITVTVLSLAADKQSVVVRTKDGKEMPILMNRLNAETIVRLTGAKTRIINGVYLPGTYNVRTLDGKNGKERVVDITTDSIIIEKNGDKEVIPFSKLAVASVAFYTGKTIPDVRLGEVARAEAKRGASLDMLNQAVEVTKRSEIGRKFAKLDAKEAARILTAPTEGPETEFVEAKKLLWRRDYSLVSSGVGSMAWTANDRFAEHFVYPSDMAKELKLDEIPLNEKVSLRPEFEKFGVGGMSNSFNELSCQYQSAYKIMNFWLAKKSMSKLSLDEFWNVGSKINLAPNVPFKVLDAGYQEGSRNIKHIDPKFFGTLLGAHIGNQPKRMTLMTGNRTLSLELAKHMLRKGNPIILSVPSTIASAHMVAIVGFETTNGVTQFEVLDRGYYWETKVGANGDSLVVWYE